ncbi:XRE family transcriptional regulator [Oscillospiraceae bacterium 42-9]
MSFPETLREARVAAGHTQRFMAEQLGIDTTTYSGYETGRRQPDVDRLRQLAGLLRISGDQLLEVSQNNSVTMREMRQLRKYRVLDVHGQDLVDTVLDKEYARMTQMDLREHESQGTVTYINCYDLAVSAGLGEPWGDSAYKTKLEVPGDLVPERAHFCVRVNGSSMLPAYGDGDIVFVERVEDFINEGETGIFFLNGDGYIKRLGRGALLSLNPEYEPIPLHDYDNLRCQGRILGKLERK